MCVVSVVNVVVCARAVVGVDLCADELLDELLRYVSQHPRPPRTEGRLMRLGVSSES